MIIAITGIPGVGKTTIAKLLSKKLGYDLIHLSEFVKKHKLGSDYDRSRKSIIVDVEKLRKKIEPIKGKDVIIDGHLSHFIPSDLVVVLRYDPKKLKTRLKRRGYPKNKIRENVEAELLDIIYAEAFTYGKKVVQIDTTKRKPKEIVELIIKAIRGKYKGDKVDWLGLYGNRLEHLIERF